LISKSNTNLESKSILSPKEQHKTNLNLKVTTGLHFISLSLDNDGGTTNHTFKTKPILAVGFEAENIFPFNKGKWSIFTNPNFQSYQLSEKNDQAQIIAADYNFIEIPIGIRHYLILNNKSRLFLDAGLSFSISLNGVLKYSGQTLEVSNTANVFSAVGCKKGPYTIQLRYSLNRELLASYFNWKAKYASAGIVLGYKFM
jgi:hypothetical protein